jgi:hypothetical protein
MTEAKKPQAGRFQRQLEKSLGLDFAIKIEILRKDLVKMAKKEDLCLMEIAFKADLCLSTVYDFLLGSGIEAHKQPLRRYDKRRKKNSHKSTMSLKTYKALRKFTDLYMNRQEIENEV